MVSLALFELEIDFPPTKGTPTQPIHFKSIRIRMPKKFYFTTSKPILFILSFYFITHLTSEFLFLYTTH